MAEQGQLAEPGPAQQQLADLPALLEAGGDVAVGSEGQRRDLRRVGKLQQIEARVGLGRSLNDAGGVDLETQPFLHHLVEQGAYL